MCISEVEHSLTLKRHDWEIIQHVLESRMERVQRRGYRAGVTRAGVTEATYLRYLKAFRVALGEEE